MISVTNAANNNTAGINNGLFNMVCLTEREEPNTENKPKAAVKKAMDL